MKARMERPGAGRLVKALLGAALIAVPGLLTPAPADAGVEPRGGYGTQQLVREPIGRVEIDVWTDRGDGAVVHQGEPVRVFFRTTEDAYVAIYDIDTEGQVTLLYPASPEDSPYVVAGRTYVVPSEWAPYRLVARGPAGIEYIEGIASAYPILDEWGYWFREQDAWLGDGWDSNEAWLRAGWIDGDPFLAIDAINRSLVPVDCPDDWFAADYTSFYIGRQVPYPRYLIPEWRVVGCDPYYDPYPRVIVNIDFSWRFHEHRHHRWFRAPRYLVRERRYPKHDRYEYRDGRVYDRKGPDRNLWDRGGSRRDRDGSPRGIDDRYRGKGDDYNRDWWRREKERDMWNNRGSLKEIEERRGWNHTWGKAVEQPKAVAPPAKGRRVEKKSDVRAPKDDRSRLEKFFDRRVPDNRIPERREKVAPVPGKDSRGRSVEKDRGSGKRIEEQKTSGRKAEGQKASEKKSDGKKSRDKSGKKEADRGSGNDGKSSGKGHQRNK